MMLMRPRSTFVLLTYVLATASGKAGPHAGLLMDAIAISKTRDRRLVAQKTGSGNHLRYYRRRTR